NARAGEDEPAGAVARPDRLLHRRPHALAAHFRRRGGARRLRSAQDVPVSAMDTTAAPLLDIRDLSVAFAQGSRELLAVDRVSFDVRRGETVALVGESGSGKSVTALSVMKLLPYPAARHPSGAILFKGRDLLRLEESEIREVRGANITVI